MRYFTPRISAIVLLTTFLIVLVFHALIMSGVIPFNMSWGGRLEDKSQMVVFEFISITVNLIMILIVLGKMDRLPLNINPKIYSIGLWVMAALFILNTIGNLFSINEFEKLIFTPVTFILAILCARLAVAEGYV